MKKKLRISAMICGAMFFGVFFLTSCSSGAEVSGSGSGSGSDGRSERFFVSLSDYNELKDDIYSSDLVNDSIKERAKEELIVGQTYCFLYFFELEDIAPQMSDRGLYNYFNMSIKTWGGIHFGTDAVDFVGFDYDDSGMEAIFNCDYGVLNLSKKSDKFYAAGLYHHYRSYICVQFNPKYEGSIYVESNIYGDYYKKAEDNKQWISASVFKSESEVIQSDKCEIKSLTYGLIDGETYDRGLLDENTDLASISEMTEGENYVVVDFDIEAINSSGAGNVICGIYLHEGSWENATLEQVNTSVYSQTDVEDGKMFDFSYKVPEEGSKKVRTVLSFTALEVCLIKLDLFVYGTGATITGTTFAGVYFSESSVAELQYEIDQNKQICRVTGLKTNKDVVIIPDRYQGYPVLEVADEAFKGSSIVSLSIGNRVQSIGFYAFFECDQLSEVDFGNSINTLHGGAFQFCSSLTSIQLPATLYSIEPDAFSYCSNLQSVEFENKFGWQLLGDNIKGFSIENPRTAAKNLTDTYSQLQWNYYAVANINILSCGVVLKSDYTEGMENPGRESLQMLIDKKEYVFILEFEITTLSQVIDPDSMHPNSVRVWINSTTKGFGFSEGKIESGDFEDFEVYPVSISENRAEMYCNFPANIYERQSVRVVFSFVPIFNDRGEQKLDIYFGKGYGRTAIVGELFSISETLCAEWHS